MLTDLSTRLVEIPSTPSHPEEIARCADTIVAWLESHQIECHKHRQGGVPTVTAQPANDSASILRMSLLDVVEAPPELFIPRPREGQRYDRGTIDDKSCKDNNRLILL